MFDDINRRLKSGEITVAEWESETRNRLALLYLAALLLRSGGAANTSPADYLLMQSALQTQYEYLGAFAADVSKDPATWLTGRLDARMNLYNNSSYAAFENFNHSFMASAGFTEERRVLGYADHCKSGKAGTPGCIELAAKGWQPIGTLPKIGEATCNQNCKCHFEYRRKSKDGTTWILDNPYMVTARGG